MDVESRESRGSGYGGGRGPPPGRKTSPGGRGDVGNIVGIVGMALRWSGSGERTMQGGRWAGVVLCSL